MLTLRTCWGADPPLPPLPTRRIGFFITTPAAEAQLELDLAEGRCPLDAQNDPTRQGLALTLFTFDAVEVRAVCCGEG